MEEAGYSAEKGYTDINLPPLMSNEDKNISGSLVLDLRKWWRHQASQELYSMRGSLPVALPLPRSQGFSLEGGLALPNSQEKTMIRASSSRTLAQCLELSKSEFFFTWCYFCHLILFILSQILPLSISSLEQFGFQSWSHQ